ncbi:transcription factor SPT20 homolog [Drosophila sulfurigaster albostrigata]|uniref:transcription factor SPT20 homolog n=1 Tax=Drosophila sulfurigaster albostrigata TaxID=89887 RepID=UPI002D21849C|nr:transcription factor SPT20 homolog [Drosophila sulfurigaster albostrigata]
MPQAGRTSINNSYSYSFSCEWISLLLMLTLPSFTTTQFASSLYNRQFYDHNQQQVQQQQGFVYPDAPVTYNQQYPAAGQSVWSSAPIVVNDEANSLQLEQQQQQARHYLPINYYSNRETDRRQTNWMNNNDNENYNYNVPTTRAANHNYNNVPGYFYPTHQVQPQSQQEVEQRELLAVADSHREEEQIVRIGGSRSLSPPIHNDYFDAPQSLRRRDFEAKYAKHFADYLRKYPQRLQPLFNTGTPYVDK